MVDGKRQDAYGGAWWRWRWRREGCQAFVEALNKRRGQEGMRLGLPTEAQGEYACRIL